MSTSRKELIDKVAYVLLDDGHNALHCHDVPNIYETAEKAVEAVLAELNVTLAPIVGEAK